MVCVLKACSTEGFIRFHGTSTLLRSLSAPICLYPIQTNKTFPNRKLLPTMTQRFHFNLMPNNIALLTQSHKAIAARKKARRGQIKEIKFDDEARR